MRYYKAPGVVDYKRLWNAAEERQGFDNPLHPGVLLFIVRSAGKHLLTKCHCGNKQFGFAAFPMLVDPIDKLAGKIDFHRAAGYSLQVVLADRLN